MEDKTYTYSYPTFKLLLLAPASLVIAFILHRGATHNTQGVLLEGFIPISPHGVSIFLDLLALLFIAAFICCIYKLGKQLFQTREIHLTPTEFRLLAFDRKGQQHVLKSVPYNQIRNLRLWSYRNQHAVYIINSGKTITIMPHEMESNDHFKELIQILQNRMAIYKR